MNMSVYTSWHNKAAFSIYRPRRFCIFQASSWNHFRYLFIFDGNIPLLNFDLGNHDSVDDDEVVLHNYLFVALFQRV